MVSIHIKWLSGFNSEFLCTLGLLKVSVSSQHTLKIYIYIYISSTRKYKKRGILEALSWAVLGSSSWSTIRGMKISLLTYHLEDWYPRHSLYSPLGILWWKIRQCHSGSWTTGTRQPPFKSPQKMVGIWGNSLGIIPLLVTFMNFMPLPEALPAHIFPSQREPGKIKDHVGWEVLSAWH